MAEVEWQRLKAPQLRAHAESGAVVIVPVAAIEQHGPHLPTMVDTRLGHEVAVRAARKATAAGTTTLVTPVLWGGISEHHMAFGATLTVSPATFQAILRDVANSLIRHGFTRILISNSHGGNQRAMQHAAETLAMEGNATVVAATYANEAAAAIGELLEDQDGVRHAEEAETSMMLALEPDLVDASALDTLATPTDRAFLSAGKASFRWRPFSHVTANGVVGNPTRARADKGEALLEAASDGIAALILAEDTWGPVMDRRAL